MTSIGEKGKPKFSPNVPEKEESPSNQTADKKKNWSKAAKKPRIKIDRTEIKCVDKSILPPDAKYKGYRTVVYEAKLPDGIRGEFGTELKAFIVYLYFGCRVTENRRNQTNSKNRISSWTNINYILKIEL